MPLKYKCKMCGTCCHEVPGDFVKRIPIYPDEADKLIEIAKHRHIEFKIIEDLVFPDIKNEKILSFIQSMFGQLNRKMLNILGYTDSMIKKIPSLFNKNGFDKFCQYLSKKGIDKVYYICYKNKYYGYFKS